MSQNKLHNVCIKDTNWPIIMTRFKYHFQILFMYIILTCNSKSSLEYFPYSTMPPKTRMRVPSTTKPYAAHPGGISPLTGGTNHWLVAVIWWKICENEKRKLYHLKTKSFSSYYSMLARELVASPVKHYYRESELVKLGRAR